MAAIQTTPRINLRRTFGAVAILLVLGLLWLVFFGGVSPSPTGGKDVFGPSGSPLVSTGAGFQLLDTPLLASVSTASVGKAGALSGSGDNVAILAFAGVAALAFTALLVFSTLRLRFGSVSVDRVRLRQVTGA